MRVAPSQKTTFAVSDVPLATTPLPAMPYRDALLIRLGDAERHPLESWSQDTKTLVEINEYISGVHAFLLTLHWAYGDHRPLVLSPDMIWLLITQGFALHVHHNAEKLRHKFVAHEGKVVIQVRRDEFVKGFAGNDWEGVFGEFSYKIREHIGDTTHRFLVREFSTTGIVEKAAMEIVLMDAMQPYFIYALETGCGIPSITLEGTPEDWKQIREGAEQLAQFDLEWWTKHLLPVLDQFVEASRGNIDQHFWQEFYKLDGGSGGPYIHGHVVNLFPYFGSRHLPDTTLLAELEFYLRQKNPPFTEAQIAYHLAEYQQRLQRGEVKSSGLYPNPFLGNTGTEFNAMKTNSVSSCVSAVPFIWNYFGQMFPMEFIAGFVGTAQDEETLALRPEIGWAVREGIS